MKTLYGIEIEDDYFNYLFSEQEKGKEIKVVNGKIIAVTHKLTEEEINRQRIYEIEERLEQLTQDFIQIQCGAIFEDEEERKKEFKSLHNELRVLLGKNPREYKRG